MTRILLLPGLGDIHWVLLKLKGFLGDDVIPEIDIWDFDGRPRSIEYLDRIPWVKRGNYFTRELDPDKALFNRLYLYKGSSDYVRDFRGYDYLIGLNGNMRHGVLFETLLDSAPVDFSYLMNMLPSDVAYGQAIKHEYGKYLVLCFSELGMFGRAWCNRMTPLYIKALLSLLREHYKLIFTGCEWDRSYTEQLVEPSDINLVGQTSLGDLLGLLKYSCGYVGWCGGNSIIAQHLLVPTIDWWSTVYFPKHDRIGWQHPKATRLCLEVEDFHVGRTPKLILETLHGASSMVA